jgi:hypothetical protein
LTLKVPAIVSDGLILRVLGAVKVTNEGPPVIIEIVTVSPSKSSVAGNEYVFWTPGVVD